MFLIDPNQVNFQPLFSLFNSSLRFDLLSLCVWSQDRTHFSTQVSSPKDKFFPHLKVLCCISATRWGPFKEFLFLLYKIFSFGPFSLMLHVEWFPFLNFTKLIKLKHRHPAASYATTDCLLSSLLSLLSSEASLPSLRVTLTYFANHLMSGIFIFQPLFPSYDGQI